MTSVFIVMTAVSGIMIAAQGSAEKSLLEAVKQQFNNYDNDTDISDVLDDQMSVNSTQFVDNLQQKVK